MKDELRQFINGLQVDNVLKQALLDGMEHATTEQVDDFYRKMESFEKAAQQVGLTKLRLDLSLKLREAEEAAYALARECEVGPERTKMFEVYERIRRVMVG